VTAARSRSASRDTGARGRRPAAAGCALLAAAIAVVTGGCARPNVDEEAPGHRETRVKSPSSALAIDAAAENRILALAPERISERDVAEVLGRAPAPRIICLHGSVPLVTMQPFAEFLVAMGYPRASLRDPQDGRYSHSSYGDSRRIAGMLAWYYERDGMMPMLIGHSQGGMLVIKTLYDLAGADRIAVWNPVTDAAEPRFTIVDPRRGTERPVVGLKVGYAAAIATGSLPRVLLGQWDILPKLRTIPDSVEEFTGFFIEWDAIAGTFPGSEPFRATGAAAVRTVTLPAAYGHITLPLTAHLAANPATRAWISAYVPGQALPAVPSGPEVDATNIVHAAEIWHSVKKRWCVEAQRQIRARRARVAAGS
jgi:hypothetical protein